MDVVNPLGPVSSIQPYLVAAVRAVDGNALATTALSWQGTASAANTLPLYIRIVPKSGTFSLMVANVQLNGVTMQAISAVQSALIGSSANPLLYPVSSAVGVNVAAVTGNWQVVVATINGSAATFDCEIWGLRIS